MQADGGHGWPSLAALLAWLWPIGIGGKMPVGGDVTQFFLGLMGFLGESLRAGELPVWNDLWGYGFPGPGGEPDGGVLPAARGPLRPDLDTETAYVVSLVLHTLWGGLGTFWASRQMGVSARRGGAGGVFLVVERVLPDPPGPSLGLHDRMLDALGLGAGLVDPRARAGGSSRSRCVLLLSLVLVLQVLPGHFQLAFQTQVSSV